MKNNGIGNLDELFDYIDGNNEDLCQDEVYFPKPRGQEAIKVPEYVKRFKVLDLQSYNFEYKTRLHDGIVENAIESLTRNNNVLHIYGLVNTGKTRTLIQYAKKHIEDTIYVNVLDVTFDILVVKFIKSLPDIKDKTIIVDNTNLIFDCLEIYQEISPLCKRLITIGRSIEKQSEYPISYLKFERPFSFEDYKIPKECPRNWLREVFDVNRDKDLLESVVQLQMKERETSRLVDEFVKSESYNASIFRVKTDTDNVHYIVNDEDYVNNALFKDIFKLVDGTNSLLRDIRIKDNAIFIRSIFNPNEDLRIPMSVALDKEYAEEYIQSILKRS